MLRAPIAAALLAIATPLTAQQANTLQERLDLDVLQRIRAEGEQHSMVDTLALQLLDGYGSRLTASTGLRRAQEWAAQTMRGWGLANVNVEAWDSLFGRGWERVSYSGRMVEPVIQPLRAEPAAWSGSTRGAVTCPVVFIGNDTTQLARFAGRLQGACVMWDTWQPIGPEFAEITRRYSPDTLLAWAARDTVIEEDRSGRRRGAGVTDAIVRFARAQGAAVLLGISRVPTTYGMLRTGAHPESRLARDSAYEPTPMLYLPHEQYGQLYRLQQRGRPARLEVNIQNRFTNPDRREYNVVGEIPGTDRAAELVMMGAHFDSWHSGQGATDNAAGSIVMLEAMRILKTLNLPMRRTVRIALWSGEEQGLIGSRHYVRMHAAEMARTSAYLNIDNGTGRIRGVYGQMNRPAMQILDQIMMPFRDAGVVASTIENTGGTDHGSFDRAGIPGFQFIQDPIEYDERTHHTSADTYERLVMADLRQAAQIIAWTAYTVSNRDELLPRKAPTRPMGTN